jgi:hypothetical protein
MCKAYLGQVFQGREWTEAASTVLAHQISGKNQLQALKALQIVCKHLSGILKQRCNKMNL